MPVTSNWELVVAKIKRVLLAKQGVDGIRAFSRALGVVDECATTPMPRTELANRLNALQVVLSEKELEALWGVFDRQGDGNVLPTEVLTALRQRLSPLRRSLLQRVWWTFDKDDRGHVSLQQLHQRYDATRHPSVLRGVEDPATVQKRFRHSFDTQTNPDGTISRQEFEQHYAGVSATIDSDSVFASELRGCWHLPGTNDEQTAALAFRDDAVRFAIGQPQTTKEDELAQLQLKDVFQRTIDTHTSQLRTERVGFRNLGRRFRAADPARGGYVTKSDFVDALWRGRLYFDEPLALQLLQTNGDDSIDYVLYMAHVKGELPPCRHLMIERRWREFPRDRTDCTTLSVIHKAYHPPNGEARSQFLDAWDKSHVKSQVVAYEEFVEWLIPFSVPIPLDNAFEERFHKEWADHP